VKAPYELVLLDRRPFCTSTPGSAGSVSSTADPNGLVEAMDDARDEAGVG
jgi:hypothetical protein